MATEKYDYLEDLFIDEVKGALNKYNSGGVSSWNDLTDRPFGEEVITLVDNRTIQIGDFVGIIEPTIALVAGQEYSIIYNGTEYKVTTIEITDNGTTGVFAGNLSMYGFEDTGEPFAIGYADSTSVILPLDGSSEVVLTVIGPVVKTIDEKYLPMYEIVEAVKEALPTWEGGDY